MMETQFLRSEFPPEGRAKYWNNILPTAGGTKALGDASIGTDALPEQFLWGSIELWIGDRCMYHTDEGTGRGGRKTC